MSPFFGRLMPPFRADPGKYIVSVKDSGLRFTSGRQLLQLYVNIFKNVVGSEANAKKKIYFVSPEWNYLSFGAEMDEETSKKLEGLGGVEVTEDFYSEARKKSAEFSTPRTFFPFNWNHRLYNMFRYQESSPPQISGDSCHWLINIDKPNGELPTAHQVVDHCVKLLSKFVQSEKEARERICVVWCVEPFGFGAEMDCATSKLLRGLPGVLNVLKVNHFDFKDKLYGPLVIFPPPRDVGGEVERAFSRMHAIGDPLIGCWYLKGECVDDEESSDDSSDEESSDDYSD